MIYNLQPRTVSAATLLSPAAAPSGTPSNGPAPLDGRVIDHWPALWYQCPGGEHWSWSAARWAQFLDEPLATHPSATAPDGKDRAAVFHLQAQLHPADRPLTDDQWALAAHELAYAAGIADAHGHGPYRWVAVRTGPRQLHLCANLIHDTDGTWLPRPRQVRSRLTAAVQRIEDRLDLVASRPGTRRPPGQAPRAPLPPNEPAGPDAQGRDVHRLHSLTKLLSRAVDERSGDLPRLRRLVENMAFTTTTRTGLPPRYTHDITQRLEWIARRLHGIQEDIQAVSGSLRPGIPLRAPSSPPRPAAAPSTPSRGRR
ncbi:hypothetical protein VSR01_28065 [Actinacidiphila sp. DG2A-62]|uniref:hypothetical protein n=1 Tax=Actinacidiphila sp. DG2A-62 TaxID=3108821 RepID=UPI002DBAF7EC|nr:hypothetical protein [Actinacidiphila sp. DG2A-62]MEC3997148.1 hypothetical protein [Actinacidiphila sp. DG2A-62]